MKNVGILGLGNIANRVAKGVLCSKKACLYTVASRNIENAKRFADKYGAKTYYGSYEEMLSDSNVDLVYICTPNTLHYEQIKMCLNYGKHVICEKPMVKDEIQVRELFAFARKRGCFLMEAEKTMFTPLNQKIKGMITNGVIGKLHTIKAQYCSVGLDGLSLDHWVLGEEFGGCTYDIGVYPICASHFYADAKMKEFQAEPVIHPEFGCDFGMDADIFYENGIYASLRANWFYQAKNKGNAVLVGDKGYFEIPAYWKGNKGYLHKDGIVTEIEVDMESDFEGEITHAIECIEEGLLESTVLGEEMSVEIIHVAEAVQKKFVYKKMIARIEQMEQYVDDVSKILEKSPDLMKKDEEIKTKIEALEKYQESGQWLRDYECDERGELPSDLKRGVLSEDKLYNLLCDIKRIMES